MKKATWANCIHIPDFLYLHRLWRFSDIHKSEFIRIMDFSDKSRILDLGCGPGALCKMIKEWFTTSNITGLDNDSTFIKFAQKHVKNCEFVEMDINKAYIEPFDYIVSHTIMEYIDSKIFFDCQNRLLKQDGQIIVISVVPGSRHNNLLWNPDIPDVNIINTFFENNHTDTSHLIDRQEYNDTSIVELFNSYDFQIINIEYLPIIIQIDKLDSAKILEYRKMLESYQINKIVTSFPLISDEKLYRKAMNSIKSYYDSIFNNIDIIKPTDIEVLRFIRAKKSSKCT